MSGCSVGSPATPLPQPQPAGVAVPAPPHRRRRTGRGGDLAPHDPVVAGCPARQVGVCPHHLRSRRGSGGVGCGHLAEQQERVPGPPARSAAHSRSTRPCLRPGEPWQPVLADQVQVEAGTSTSAMTVWASRRPAVVCAPSDAATHDHDLLGPHAAAQLPAGPTNSVRSSAARSLGWPPSRSCRSRSTRLRSVSWLAPSSRPTSRIVRPESSTHHRGLTAELLGVLALPSHSGFLLLTRMPSQAGARVQADSIADAAVGTGT